MRTPSGRCRLALALALFLPCGLAVAQDAPATPGFKIKQDTPDTGSNIRRDAVWGGSLPYDKTYAELSPEQQRTFKSRYVDMPEGDEPPFPVDGLGPLLGAIYRVSRSVDVGVGKLEMDVYVDETGSATKVDVIRTPDAQLAKHAATIAMLTKFKPALCQGKPCAMGFPVSLGFVRR
jgi:hypothetical protein